MFDATSPPFSVLRDGPRSLTEQTVRGIARAIRSGHYENGQRLPTILELSRQLGVSDIVVRNAIKRLSVMGLIIARRCDGIRVRSSGAPRSWRAHVLQLVRAPQSSFFFAVRDNVLQEKLRQDRVRLSSLLVNDAEARAGCPGLREFSEDDPPDLAILEEDSPGVPPVLEKRRIPFIHLFAFKPSPLARASLNMDAGPGSRALAQHATACGVRSVLGVYIAGMVQSTEESAHFKKAMRDAGLKCRILFVKPAAALPVLESFEFGGMTALTAYLQRHPTLPGLIHFSDDFLARGGLAALQAAGKRIPEDVQVSTLINRGNRIAFPKALTYLEADPVATGELMAQLAIHALDLPQRQTNVVVVQTKLVPGETTVLRKPKSAKE